MSDDNSISAVNLSGLSKPINTLIEKISGAIEGGCKPWQIKRVAKAEAAAELIHAENEIAISELELRAMRRFVSEEAKKQANMESIAEKAFPKLQADTDANKMDDDWVVNFFEKCRVVSSEQMQELWAKILAGEANSPGSVSKRAINLLSDMDQSEAETFQTLCRFAVLIDENVVPFVDEDEGIYENTGLYFEDLAHLDSIGLLHYDAFAGFNQRNVPESFVLEYFGTVIQCTLYSSDDYKYVTSTDHKQSIPIGYAIFTAPAIELMKFCTPTPVDGFVEYLVHRWKNHSPVVVNPDQK
ncbi:MAG: DUF2806 domain-containing protein [Phycisphaera sp.]|nr:MAG: DUF2806 domain-containing protein [Phycisphaera sp.]